MSIRIALAGNPNSGKTTMFNDLPEATRCWQLPGVQLKKRKGDLKGTRMYFNRPARYLLSLPLYTGGNCFENYLINEKPDAIIDIVDGANIERNLYLTTQLTEMAYLLLLHLI